jgi:outer membrane protein assembly factor BamE (lipoprotein component of BamABCDE complex)
MSTRACRAGKQLRFRGVSMRPLLPLALAAGVLAAGCTPLRSHQGYIVDADLVNSIQPGVDNRQSVLATLGTPSFASQFNQGDWYYVSRDSRNLAFTPPKPRDQLTMQISFDQAGNVTTVRKSGIDQVVSLKPDDPDAGPQARLLPGPVRQHRHGRRGGRGRRRWSGWRRHRPVISPSRAALM